MESSLEREDNRELVLVQTEAERSLMRFLMKAEQQIDLKGKVRSGQFCYENLNWH